MQNTAPYPETGSNGGSGKTICAEFDLLRLHKKGTDSVFRCVYIDPIEALAKEQYRIGSRNLAKDWN